MNSVWSKASTYSIRASPTPFEPPLMGAYAAELICGLVENDLMAGASEQQSCGHAARSAPHDG